MDYKEQAETISDLEIQIDRLRALYEQYFMGIEKLEPQIPRKQVERTFRFLRKERINNTALRFRFLMLVQRYNTMENYWRRVVRKIEEGTYRRLVMRSNPDTVPPPSQESRLDKKKKRLPVHEVDLDEFDETNPSLELPPEILDDPPQPGGPQTFNDDTQPSIAELTSDPSLGRSGPANRTAAAPPPPPPRGPSRSGHGARPRPARAGQGRDALTENRIYDIYRDYVSARQRCNQPTHGLTIEKVTQQIRRQEDVLKKKHGKEVDFQVVVKDGRAILKAVKKPS